MKNRVKIKAKPRRITRAERQNAKFTQKANEELQRCVLAGEFHKAYLAVELGCEEEKLEKLKARLAALQPEVETVETVAEEETIIGEAFEDLSI